MFIGASKIFGSFLADIDTIPSKVQNFLNNKNIQCKIEVFAGNGFDEYIFEKYIHQYNLNMNTIIILSIDRSFGVTNGSINKLDESKKALHQIILIKRIKEFRSPIPH